MPPKRHILRDISLSFFPGAKIGVLGLNGAGKSTLLRIMAGVDKEYRGRSPAAARHQDRLPAAGTGTRPGQDRPRNRRGRRRRNARISCNRFNEISEKFAEPLDDDEMNALLEEQGKLQDKIDAA